MKAKNDYILRMTSKLIDPKTAPKTYWSILSRFSYNKDSRNSRFISKWSIFLLQYVHQ